MNGRDERDYMPGPEDLSSPQRLEAALARMEDESFEESFEVHERLMSGGRTLNGMLRDAMESGGAEFAETVLATRAAGMTEGDGLTPERAKRYARYAARGIFPPKTVDRIIDKYLLMKRYPAFEGKFDAASDWAAHRRVLEDGLRSGSERPGLRLGIEALDLLVNSGRGAAPGEIFLMVGPEGSMKTSLALHMMCRYVESGGRALYISLDMPPERIEERLLLRLANLGPAELRDGIRRGSPEYGAAARAREEDYGGLRVIGGPMGIDGVRAAALASGAGVVALDYVTAVSGMESELETARAVAALARDMGRRWGITLLLLSQMSWASQRDRERGGRGGHAMGGGSLGQAADFELELYSDTERGADGGGLYRPLIATLRKNRSGRSGASFEIFPSYPSLAFEDRSRAVEQVLKPKALFTPVKLA